MLFRSNTLLYGVKFAQEAEFIAISAAFRIAWNYESIIARVMIFSDCRGVLQGMRTGKIFATLSRLDLVDDLVARANDFSVRGINVELHWVPSHANVSGNKRVDE